VVAVMAKLYKVELLHGACPVCNGARRDCRKTGELVHCYTHNEPPAGYEFKGISRIGASLYAPISVGANGIRNKDLERIARKERQAARQAFLDSLPTLEERDRRIKAHQTTLTTSQKADLLRRGLTHAEIDFACRKHWLFACETGYGISAIDPVTGLLCGAQIAKDDRSESPYTWGVFAGKNQLRETGENPLFVWRSSRFEASKSYEIKYCEGALKSLIRAFLEWRANPQIVVIGAAGGIFGHNAIQRSISAFPEPIAHVMLPDSDTQNHKKRNIETAYRNLLSEVPSIKFADWGHWQSKDGKDCDETYGTPAFSDYEVRSPDDWLSFFDESKEVVKKLEKSFGADLSDPLTEIEFKLEEAIAEKNEVNDSVMELNDRLKNLRIKDPFDTAIAPLEIELKALKTKLRTLNSKINDLKSDRVHHRIVKKQKESADRLAKRDAEKDNRTSFEKDYEVLKELLFDPGRLRYNLLTLQVEIDGEPNLLNEPRANLVDLTGFKGWNQGDDAILKIVVNFAKKKAYCPITDYLEYTAGMNIEHTFLDNVAERIYGVTDPLQNLYFKTVLIGSVRRVFETGCYYPYMPILYSASQRVGKSTSLKTLYGLDFSSEGQLVLSDPDSILILNQVWMHEIPEVEWVFRGQSNSVMKDVLTRTKDSYRRPYDRAVTQSPRRTVIWGTTNHKEILTDSTGNKRFLIIEIPEGKRVDWGFLQASRDLIWSAAMDAYRRNIPSELDDAATAASELANKAHMEIDPWSEAILQWLQEPARRHLTELLDLDIFVDGLGFDKSRLTKKDSDRLGTVMRTLGWERKQKRVSGDRVRYWVKLASDSNEF
jgi:predicted P-loop ATPase